jgi:hypothetical protein
LKFTIVESTYDIVKITKGLDFFLEKNDKSVELLKDAIISGKMSKNMADV